MLVRKVNANQVHDLTLRKMQPVRKRTVNRSAGADTDVKPLQEIIRSHRYLAKQEQHTGPIAGITAQQIALQLRVPQPTVLRLRHRHLHTLQNMRVRRGDLFAEYEERVEQQPGLEAGVPLV